MLEFSGSSNGEQFQANLKFFKPVTAEDSIMNVRPGSVVMKIMKKDQDEVLANMYWHCSSLVFTSSSTLTLALTHYPPHISSLRRLPGGVLAALA